MTDSRPEDDRPAEATSSGASGASGSAGAPPPPPPAPPGSGPDDPWSPGPPQQRPPDGYAGTAGPYAGQYGETAPAPQNGLGTAALVLGIVGLLFAVLFFPLGFVLAAVGLVLGILGLKRAKRGLATNRGVALAGTALSVLALVVCIGWGVVIGVLVNKAQGCNDPDLSRTEQRHCIEDKLGGLTG